MNMQVPPKRVEQNLRQDQPGLLAAMAGVLALHGLDVREAGAGLVEGAAVERFVVERSAGRAVDAARLVADLRAAVAGTLLIEPRLAEVARAYAGVHRRSAATAADVVVTVDNGASERATVVEVRAPDSRGLLHVLAGTLAHHGLDVASAHVSTLGHEVVDTFYVTLAGAGPGAAGGKLVDPARVDALREAIARAVAAMSA